MCHCVVLQFTCHDKHHMLLHTVYVMHVVCNCVRKFVCQRCVTNQQRSYTRARRWAERKKESGPVRSPRAAHSSCRERAASNTAELLQYRMLAHSNIKIKTHSGLNYINFFHRHIHPLFHDLFSLKNFVKTRNRVNFNLTNISQTIFGHYSSLI